MALSSRVRRTAVGAFLVAAVAVTAPAIGAPNKSFSVGVQGSAYAGKTSTFTLTFKAPPKQTLGSAKVTLPTGFSADSESVTAPPPTSVVVDGQTVTLNNLAIAPDAEKVVTITAAVACVDAAALWSVQAKQANEFNGSPGNDLQPSPLTFSTPVLGQCVPCLDDESAEAVCFADEELTGAKFNLKAPANETSDGGDLTLASNTGLVLTCADHKPVAGTVLFDFTGTREKIARLVVAKKSLPAGGINGLKLCYGAPTDDDELTEQAGKFDWDGDGIADPVYVQLLPDCANAADTRCVTARGKVGQDGFIEARLPIGDPGMRG